MKKKEKKEKKKPKITEKIQATGERQTRKNEQKKQIKDRKYKCMLTSSYNEFRTITI